MYMMRVMCERMGELEGEIEGVRRCMYIAVLIGEVHGQWILWSPILVIGVSYL